MPVVIGAKRESGFSDPIGLLGDCHRRIERFLSVLVQLAALRGAGLSEEQRKSLETALAYFRDAAPKHTADEEETLFPRLRRSDNAGVRAVVERVEGLEKDHEEANRLHEEVDRLGREWLSTNALAQPEAERYAAAVGRLEALYRGHIAIEEGEVFPAAASSLSKEDREVMGREMAQRRGLKSA